METNTLNQVIHRLRQTAFRHEDASVADGELLDYYASRGDAGAFEALVRWHGPMVYGAAIKPGKGKRPEYPGFFPGREDSTGPDCWKSWIKTAACG
jgi:hypothetical protein